MMTGATSAEIRRSVTAALRALEEAQEPDGSFPLTVVPSQPPVTPADNLFSTAMVLGLLPGELSPETVSRATAYLLGRREAQGPWAWVADGSLPPDADDTACCLGALAAVGAALDRAGGVRLLRRFWRLGGPFRTWLARGTWGSRDRDDPVVNCNVLWAIQQLGAAPRRAERAAVGRIVARARGATRYYCSAASVAWAAARVGIPTPRLLPPADALLAGRPLECALWLLASREPRPAAGKLLLDMQEADGSWPAEAWLHDHRGEWQSQPVTTAFAVAALSRMTALT
jgi:hypothetical protein